MRRPRGYPATRYHPTPLVDFSVRAERERLSPAALQAFFNIMARWQVRDEDARALLGGVTNGPFYEMKKNPDRVLDADRLLAHLLPGRHLQGAQPALLERAGRCVDAAAEHQRDLRRPDAARLPDDRRPARDADRAPAARCPPRRLSRAVRLIRQRDTHRLIPSKYRRADSVLARIADDDERPARDLRARAGDQRSPAGRAPAVARHRPARARLRRAVLPRHQRRVLPSASARRALQRPGPRRVVRGLRAADGAGRGRLSRVVELAEIGWHADEIATYDDYLADFSGEFHDLRGDRRFAPASIPTATSRRRRSASGCSTRGSLGVVYPSVRHAGRHLPGVLSPGARGQRAAGRAVRVHVRGRELQSVKRMGS